MTMWQYTPAWMLEGPNNKGNNMTSYDITEEKTQTGYIDKDGKFVPTDAGQVVQVQTGEDVAQ